MQNTRTPHERRQHALQIAGVITALIFMGWLATLGLRFGTQGPVVEEEQTANTAAALHAVEDSPLLGY